MNQRHLPLLLFPKPSRVDRETGTSNPPQLHIPSHVRQRERISPMFDRLISAFDARRLEMQVSAPNNDPDLVIVFETIGAVEDFISAAKHVSGIEWFAGMAESNIVPDEDFFDTNDHEKELSGKLFLLGSNRQALNDVVRLWDIYREDSNAHLDEGLNAWKGVFAHLKDVRFWGPQDRISPDVREMWLARLEQNVQSVRFEIEAWCFESSTKNAMATTEVSRLVREIGGTVLDELLLSEISYHAFLVELPASGLRELLDNTHSGILLSEQVMFFRPRGQATAGRGEIAPRMADTEVPQQLTSGAPIIAILDGLPMANHPRLKDRLMIEDPHDWAASYPANAREHGTAMASLIAWGELDGAQVALPNPIYVHPILRPDSSSDHQERTPDDCLLIDLVHEAVRRMFDGAPGIPPTAPTVKIINLSVGDKYRPFAGELSPWARLLDWLSYKYKVLFIVSSGNCGDDLQLTVPRESLASMSPVERSAAAMSALLAQDSHRRILAPAESVNAITIGANYSDGSTPREIPRRYALFANRGVAPYSCIGPGFRRAIKPDILLPGGRVLYSEQPTSPVDESHMTGIWKTPQSPGHLVASPPDPSGNNTIYSRGTSNAAALGTRAAAQAHAVLEQLRSESTLSLPRHFDAILIKSLLVHGAQWGDIEPQILSARPDVEHWHAQRRLVARYAGYGLADVDRALTCTEQRATLIGIGELKNNKALEFKVPIPRSLSATLVRRRLTITLAWLTPLNPRHSKYRVARLWADLPTDPLRLERINGESKQMRLGTVQHEIFEGDSAVPIVEEQDLVVRVNCVADAGRLFEPVGFALCVSLEVADGLPIQIYNEVRERIMQRVNISAASESL
jgi:hypothetical protein